MKLLDKPEISMKMKTKLTSVTYFGYTAMDRRFSNAMLPWLLREIRSANIRDKLSIAVEDGCLKAYNGNFEPIIVHRLVDIIRASQVPGRPEELFYIVLNESEGLLNCYMFSGTTADEVTDLFVQMRDPSPASRGSATSLNGAVTKNHSFQQQNSSEHLPWSNPAISVPGNSSNISSEAHSPLVRSVSNASALTTLCADLSLSDSHFFEVLYIGKVRISQRKVPESLIDDALTKFAQHEAEKARNLRRHSLLSSTATSIYSNDSAENLNEEKRPNSIEKLSKNVQITPSTTPLEPVKANPWRSAENLTSNKIKDTKEVDEDFDVFSKERVDNEFRPHSQIPLEPNVVVLNVTNTKNSLSTLEEDEEKNEDLHSMISETATSITQYCLKIQSEENDNVKNKENKTESTTELETEITKNKSSLENESEANELSIEKKTIREDSPASIVSFPEIQTKPRSLLRSKTGLDNLEKRATTMPENKPFLRDRSASIGTLNLKTPIAQLIGEQNRTMLFQVGRSELRLISPDRKQILLHRAFKDVASCVMGRQNKDHFGFVCRETTESYACYVFKCESDSVATEVVNAIKQAFLSHSDLLKKTREKSPNMTCEHCPMLWYHRLCHDVEGMNDKKTYMFILRRLGQLPVEEQDLIVTKYQGGATHMIEERDHNVFLMMLLRAHCEGKQQRHVHDTVENRSEFLNQYLGGSTIFMKAKRSLSSGFDHLLKRRSSKDDGNVLVHVKKEPSPQPVQSSEPTKTAPELLSPDPTRAKSMSPGAPDNCDPPVSPRATNPPAEEEDENSPNSPMMDIFLKVSDNRPVHADAGAEPEATWRQVIYEKVIQPPDAEATGRPPIRQGKRTKEQLRELWKMAIDQTILLVRMDKENAKLKEGEESSAVRRIKLEYSELGACDAGVTLMWDSLLSRNSSQPMSKVDRHMLTQAVMQGVPRQSRGAVWYFLAEQAALRGPAAPPSARTCPRYHQPYRALIADLTKHHHSILIDLGRTFPQHSYFASALGPGQLALYNILKAYSLLDPEVGYCQGLSFVAGVLLLHMDEAEAFVLLRHLMFRRGLRKQYLPDMSALQVQMYQLSRLVRDHEPELHARLAALDIAPALYAAPWMLTLFTSQFPLGFVVRVYDLIFLDSLDVIFSVSLALLAAHRDGLMLCESCEEAAEYLKHKLPDMDKGIFDKVMKKVHTLDISRQLADYAVEYAVLREEMPRLGNLTDDNRRLVAENTRMSEELDSAMAAIENYQSTQSRIESQNKSLEQQITLLSRYISAHHKQDMPIEIKKIIHNYSKKLSFSSKISSFSSKFTSNEEEDPKKNLKSGTSAPNLFAKITKEELMNAVNKEKIRTEDKRSLMKKSQSVHSGLISNNTRHYPLKVLEEKAEGEDFRTDIITESLKELGRKNSGFFANTHEQIRQERLFEQQLKLDFDKNLKKLDEKLDTEETDDLSIFQSRKSMSLNLKSSMKGDTKFNDSGFVTPLSPNDRDNRKDDSVSIISHPLSDVDVDIKFDGQSTKLKQIRPVRHNIDSIDSK